MHDQRLFLVSGYMNTSYGGIWKQWPHYLDRDDRIILRVDGRLRAAAAARHGGSGGRSGVVRIARKYFGGADGAFSSDESIRSGDTWMYEVVDR